VAGGRGCQVSPEHAASSSFENKELRDVEMTAQRTLCYLYSLCIQWLQKKRKNHSEQTLLSFPVIDHSFENSFCLAPPAVCHLCDTTMDSEASRILLLSSSHVDLSSLLKREYSLKLNCCTFLCLIFFCFLPVLFGSVSIAKKIKYIRHTSSNNAKLLQKYCQKHSFKLISGLLGTELMLESRQLGSHSVLVHSYSLDTKYYTAAVEFVTSSSISSFLAANTEIDCEALLLAFDPAVQESFSSLSAVVPFIEKAAPELMLCICDRGPAGQADEGTLFFFSFLFLSCLSSISWCSCCVCEEGESDIHLHMHTHQPSFMRVTSVLFRATPNPRQCV
jgi:hypothetical protein